MKRDEGLAAALFAVVIGGAVALAIVGDITAPACKAARTALQGAKDFDFGCGEFFFNRYQSFIVGVLALIGAGVTISVMRWQTATEAKRRRKIALMRVLAELRPFRLACEDLFFSLVTEDNARSVARVIPSLKFPREPELLADLREFEARDLMFFALIVDRVRNAADTVQNVDIPPHEYLAAFSAKFAEEAFDLINETASSLDWGPDHDRPSNFRLLREMMLYAEELRPRVFGS